MARKNKNRISDEAIVETIIQMCAADEDGAVRPEDIAMEIYPLDWQSLTKRIRLIARQLAEAGHVIILRKGQATDPSDFKGIYRLQINPAFFNESA